jgi:redox-sensitive bicupin YhaK (pirin superfamily)
VKARGLQLWVNLAREFKMVEPAYQELTADQVTRSRSQLLKTDQAQNVGVSPSGFKMAVPAYLV